MPILTPSQWKIEGPSTIQALIDGLNELIAQGVDPETTVHLFNSTLDGSSFSPLCTIEYHYPLPHIDIPLPFITFH